eukprot:m51a1_g11342 putative ras gtpase activation domain-containing protein (659) ;mRNA; f:161737-164036
MQKRRLFGPLRSGGRSAKKRTGPSPDTIAALRDLFEANPQDFVWAVGRAGGAGDPSPRVCDHLVALLRSKGLAVPFLRSAIAAEVEATPLGPQLFRSSSVATRLLASLYRDEALSWVQLCLRASIQRICAIETPLEIDPARLVELPDAEAVAARNAAQLNQLLQEVFDGISECADRCPMALRALWAHARQVTERRFPELKLVVVGGLAFLRLIVPAFVTPEQFSLAQSQLQPHTRRTLILMSKGLQLIANETFVASDISEPFMIPILPFVQRNIEPCRRLLAAISVMPDGVDTALQATVVPPPAQVDAAYAEIYGEMQPYEEKFALLLQGMAPEFVQKLQKALHAGEEEEAEPEEVPADEQEDTLRRDLHKKIDDAFSYVHEKYVREHQARVAAEAELARVEKENERLKDLVEALKRELRQSAKRSGTDVKDKEGRRKTTPPTGVLVLPSQSPTPIEPEGSMAGAASGAGGGQLTSSGSSYSLKTDALVDDFPPERIVKRRELVRMLGEARSIVSSMSQRVSDIAEFDKLVYLAKVTREIHRAETVPIEEEFKPNAVQLQHTRGVDASAPDVIERVTTLRKVVNLVISQIREYLDVAEDSYNPQNVMFYEARIRTILQMLETGNTTMSSDTSSPCPTRHCPSSPAGATPLPALQSTNK